MESSEIVRMANQIADFYKPYSEKEALEGIAEHINKFWEPRMRREFFSLVDKGGAGLNPLVVAAAIAVKRPKETV